MWKKIGKKSYRRFGFEGSTGAAGGAGLAFSCFVGLLATTLGFSPSSSESSSAAKKFFDCLSDC